MSNEDHTPAWRALIPRYEIPPLPPMNGVEKVALLIGTGLGSGFTKPMAPSWGSIPGFGYFLLISRLPIPVAVAVSLLLCIPSVWSGTICERLLARKDPRPVVIDEIAAVPFALWPLWFHWPTHFLTWIILFAIYRFADFLKPWPANSLQSVHGGLGILVDDLISSTYMSVALHLFIRCFPSLL
jgi:phosphatidylglycerophosphatase A